MSTAKKFKPITLDTTVRDLFAIAPTVEWDPLSWADLASLAGSMADASTCSHLTTDPPEQVREECRPWLLGLQLVSRLALEALDRECPAPKTRRAKGGA